MEPIQFPTTKFALSADTRKAVNLRYPDCEYPIHGKLANLKISIPLSLNSTKLKISKYFELDRKEQDKILNEILQLSPVSNSDELDKRQRTQKWITSCASIFFTVDPNTDMFKALINLCLTLFEKRSHAGIEVSRVYNEYPIWKRAFDGEFEALENLEDSSLSNAINTIIETAKLFNSEIPNFRSVISPWLRTLFRATEAGPFLTHPEDEKFSVEGMKKVHEAEQLGQFFLETNALLAGIQIPQYVRSSMLCRVFFSSFNLSTAVLNNLVGLQEALGSNQHKSAIIGADITQGITLERCLQKATTLLKDAVNDVYIAGLRLVEAFSETKAIADFVQVAEQTYNSQVYASIIDIHQQANGIEAELIAVE